MRLARHNFTMIEMVVVVVIIAVISTVVLLRSPAEESAEAELMQWRDWFLELAADSRRSAMMTRARLDVRYDGTTRQWRLPHEMEAPALSKELEVMISGEKAPAEELTVLSFFPDGQVTGLPLELKLDGNHLELRASELTGALLIRLNSPEDDAETEITPLFSKE